MNTTFSKAFILLIAATVMAACSKTQDPFTIGANFKTDVEILSGDDFEGRAPASPGGIKTKEYIESRFREIGLRPGNGDSYLQSVPLLEVEGSNFSPLTISGSNFDLSFNYLTDMVVGTYRLEESIELNNSDMVFVGYGIVAPEYGWNDYAGLDVAGKTVVMLVNDPGFVTLDPTMFTGKAMTYYGRWTYKFEEAARQGAAAALVIHQTEPASYGWEVVRNSWSGTQYGIVVNGNAHRLPVEGWIQLEAAQQIFGAAGIDLDRAMADAAKPGFSPIALNAKASTSFSNSFQHSECHNVVGYIEGSRYPNETFIYMAHWDHLGTVDGPEGKEIYNGALDNATGVATLFAVAEAFQSADTAPERSVVFISVTAEESGLLGSRFYGENPLFPVATTVGGINIDALNVYGATHDVTSVGYGFSELDSYLGKHAQEQGRVVTPDPYPERGSYYRSDHFNMARQGVPMIYAKGGNDFIGRDEAYSQMVRDDYAGRYHTPEDVIHDLWDYEGMYRDIELFFHIGKELTNSRVFPNWTEGNEFRAIRDATADTRNVQ